MSFAAIAASIGGAAATAAGALGTAGTALGASAAGALGLGSAGTAALSGLGGAIGSGLTGAGLGAAGSALMGQDPGKGALLGGVTGGVLGGVSGATGAGAANTPGSIGPWGGPLTANTAPTFDAATGLMHSGAQAASGLPSWATLGNASKAFSLGNQAYGAMNPASQAAPRFAPPPPPISYGQVPSFMGIRRKYGY